MEEKNENKSENKIGNNITELVFIIDKSGSMSGMEADTIGGFNAMIEKQKKEAGKVIVSTVLFASSTKVLHDMIDLNEVKPLTTEDYVVGGCTALLDAIGGAIDHIVKVHKELCPEDIPAHTLFLITTDGMENASRYYSDRKVKEMIKSQTDEYGWEFVFVAANIDAAETAKHIGIRKDRTANYVNNKEGVASLYKCFNEVAFCVRRNEELKDLICDDITNNEKKN